MPQFTVRIVGTAPVWADVKVEAPDAWQAYRKVNKGDVPDLEELSSEVHEWQFCEGGNGIDDWEPSGDVYDADGEAVMEDHQLLKKEEA